MYAKPRTTTLRWRFSAWALLAVMAVGAMRSSQAVAQCTTCPCNICIANEKEILITGSVTADCIQVETTGKLRIEGAGKLTLIGPGMSKVDGKVLMTSDPEHHPELAFAANDHEVTGNGKITGFDDSVQITIASGVKLTSGVKITGNLQISGAGDFTNEGCVTTGPDAGKIDILVTGTIDDEVGACWEVKWVDTVLRFREEPACLKGDFKITSGELRAGVDQDPLGDDIDVITTGNLQQTGGKIIAGVNDSFKFGAAICP